MTGGRLLMRVAWPAFLAACLLEALVFALVDPLELHWSGTALGWSRGGVYTAAFFAFWSISCLCGALTVLLERTRADERGGIDTA